MSGFIRIRSPRKSGVTLVECMVAVAISSLGLGALVSVNSHQFRVVHSTHNANLASLCIQERMEQMRIAAWSQITDCGYLRTTFYASAPKAGNALQHVYEKITVNAYPDPAGVHPLVVERIDDQAPEIRGPGVDIPAQKSVRVDVFLSYLGPGGRTHTRQACMVLSNGGVNRFTLPAFGSAASGTSSTGDGSGSSGGGGSTPPVGGGSPGGGSGSGNGEGRGNVGGQSGKK